jgi:ribonuclease BN (tRNA processing enzyme)
MIEMLVLGAGGAVPTPTHSPAAYWIEADGVGVLVDPGPGALVRLLKHPGGPDSLDGVDRVLLTHLHLDHCADLAPLLFALHSPVLSSEAEFVLVGPPGLAAYLERLRALYGTWLDPRRRTLVVREHGPGECLELASLTPGTALPIVELFAANHPQDRFVDQPLILRIRDCAGRTLVFSGDTAPCPDLVAASTAADLLVVECSTSDGWTLDGHMNPTRVAELCALAGPRRVALTHQYPDAAARDLASIIEKAAGVQVQQLRDGDRLVVTSAEESPP